MGKNAIKVLLSLISNREWSLEFSKEALKDLKFYERTGLLETILAAILEGHNNPLPKEDGGTGHLLGIDKDTGDGRPALYWKLSSIGIRIVYGLEPPVIEGEKIVKKKNVLILVIGNRRNKEVYHDTIRRLKRYRPRLIGSKYFKTK
ncbi:hypothetical protein L7E55_14715 [Pelotomaculum isophthalicicum JI]|uniref:Uncharacterized protein n=1 Tax=Pelotomaculum isophthalicicum JI TaxID=947010 RepID=A0A9X4H5E4_9FIRM|nr:hypothetical protein [Pelotomaculum isophthalicicum]MDF9409588.1 hypothetical protein [Pelotomaculum isophthalicicum JI]